MYKSIIKKQKKKHYKVILLNTVEVFTCKILIDLYITHDWYIIVSITNLLNEHDDMKEVEIDNIKTSSVN